VTHRNGLRQDNLVLGRRFRQAVLRKASLGHFTSELVQLHLQGCEETRTFRGREDLLVARLRTADSLSRHYLFAEGTESGSTCAGPGEEEKFFST